MRVRRVYLEKLALRTMLHEIRQQRKTIARQEDLIANMGHRIIDLIGSTRRDIDDVCRAIRNIR